MLRRLLAVFSVLVMVLLGLTPPGGAQTDEPSGSDATWTALDQLPPPPPSSPGALIQPDAFAALALDSDALAADLAPVPAEPSPGVQPAGGGAVVSLPHPDGGFEDFTIFEAPIMEPGLAAQFPDIKTYGGQGVDDPAATVKIDVSSYGFHAQVLSPDGAWYIDPAYHLDTSAYISYFKADLTTSPHDPFTEDLLDEIPEAGGGTEDPPAGRSGTQLRTHRAAFSATGEYTAFHGGTVGAGQAAIVTSINRVNGIYEVELAIRMVLVANNNLLVFTNAGTDPFCNCGGDINTNQTVVDGTIGNANYDIGHVYTTASGGIAGLAVVGVTGQKARGTTGTATPINDPFVVDFVAHEVGHQYGGNHPFNGNRGSCTGGNRNGPTAYEPGSGSTIQAYAGICGLDDLQRVATGATGASDPYFHSISFDEMVAHTTGGSPGDIGAAPTGNSVPTANAGPNGAIPASTPFLLEGAGTDANGDALTYNFEQRNLGPQRGLDNPDIVNGPLFRSLVPTASNTRYLPDLAQVAAGNTNVTGGCPALTGTIGAAQDCWSEFIPTASRTLNFRLTVRDNRPNGGGVNTDDLSVSVIDTGAAFAVTSQSTPVTYPAGSNQTVTWNVAGTTAAPISAANVDIFLSTDGGASYPNTLVTGTANDGSQAVLIPNLPTTQARIMVVESGTGPGARFFNVNSSNFTIGGGGCPNNDTFACASTIGGPPATANGSNVGFGVEAGEPTPSCVGSAQTAWWNWTAPSTSGVTIDTVGSNFDTVLAVYTGNAVNTLNETACNDDAAGLQSAVTFNATAGTTYRIQVGGFGAASGNITLNISSAAGATCNGLAVTVFIGNGGVPTAGNDVILGTAGPDFIPGSNGDDTICALGGDDVVNGGMGNDWIDGGDGNDTIGGQDGGDTLMGGSGNDQLFGDGGNDTVNGDGGNDLLRGSSGIDVMDGGAGVDDLQAGSGNDVNVHGGDGADLVRGGGGADTLDGDADNDVVQGGTGNDTVNGGTGNDTVTGNANDDTLNGGDDDDMLFGGPGFDVANGGSGEDIIRGNDGADDLRGDGGNDTLFGDNGNDLLDGGSGNDTLNGGNNADTLFGNSGVDDLNGNQGGDQLDGGGGTPDDCNGGAGPDVHLGGCEIITNIP